MRTCSTAASTSRCCGFGASSTRDPASPSIIQTERGVGYIFASSGRNALTMAYVANMRMGGGASCRCAVTRRVTTVALVLPRGIFPETRTREKLPSQYLWEKSMHTSTQLSDRRLRSAREIVRRPVHDLHGRAIVSSVPGREGGTRPATNEVQRLATRCDARPSGRSALALPPRPFPILMRRGSNAPMITGGDAPMRGLCRGDVWDTAGGRRAASCGDARQAGRQPDPGPRRPRMSPMLLGRPAHRRTRRLWPALDRGTRSSCSARRTPIWDVGPGMSRLALSSRHAGRDFVKPASSGTYKRLTELLRGWTSGRGRLPTSALSAADIEYIWHMALEDCLRPRIDALRGCQPDPQLFRSVRHR